MSMSQCETANWKIDCAASRHSWRVFRGSKLIILTLFVTLFLINFFLSTTLSFFHTLSLFLSRSLFFYTLSFFITLFFLNVQEKQQRLRGPHTIASA